jgi:hypothetical protein
MAMLDQIKWGNTSERVITRKVDSILFNVNYEDQGCFFVSLS